MRRGREGEQANFLEPCAVTLGAMWGGKGVPFFTYENVPGVQELLFEGEIIDGFKELFPPHGSREGRTRVPLVGAGVCTISLWGVSSRVLPTPAAILGYFPV